LLVGMARIDTKAQVRLDRRIEVREGGVLDQCDGLIRRVIPRTIDPCSSGDVFLAVFGCHVLFSSGLAGECGAISLQQSAVSYLLTGTKHPPTKYRVTNRHMMNVMIPGRRALSKIAAAPTDS
jgi:hypothetical protein